MCDNVVLKKMHYSVIEISIKMCFITSTSSNDHNKIL